MHERKRVAGRETGAGYRCQRHAIVAVDAVKPVRQPCVRATCIIKGRESIRYTVHLMRASARSSSGYAAAKNQRVIPPKNTAASTFFANQTRLYGTASV